MKLLKLAPSQRVQGRWLLHLEDGSLLRVGENEVVSFGLYAGMELSGERLEELRDKCTNPIRPIALDLSDLSSIDAYQALLEQEQPEIKMLVNAAGCGVFGPFAEAARKKLLASAQLNSLALTGMCHASLPYMHAGSSIINMGSNSAWQPVPYQAVYGASKSYVLSLSRALGRELRPQGILLPGNSHSALRMMEKISSCFSSSARSAPSFINGTIVQP